MVNLDEDVAAAVEQFRMKEHVGFNEAVNRLARLGASLVGAGQSRQAFSQPTADLGEMVDVSNVAEALEVAELDRR